MLAIPASGREYGSGSCSYDYACLAKIADRLAYLSCCDASANLSGVYSEQLIRSTRLWDNPSNVSTI